MPNIVICGTPGTGKSKIVEELKKSLTDYRFINLSEYAIDHKYTSSYDEELETHVIDEEEVLKNLEPELEKSNNHIIEYIHGDMIHPDLIDWVFVCRTDITILHPRLERRRYNEEKIKNNIESEIFQSALDESIDYYGDRKVTQLFNNTPEDLEFNVRLILDRINRLIDEGIEK